MKDTFRINVVLPNKQHNVLKFLAERRGTTVSDIVRSAVSDFVRDELLTEKAVTEKMQELGIPE